MKTVLVLGGTGMLGAPITSRLVADGFTVRVLARDPAWARDCLNGVADAVDIIKGDATDRAVVLEAAGGCDVVHVSVGPPVDRITAELAARVAAEVGAERLGYLSGTTVAEAHAWFPMIAEKLAAERAVMESGVPWTVFCPTWPFEQLPRFLRNGRPILLGEVRHAWHWFAADDLARMVSAAYRDDATAGKRLHVHGPEAMTARQALERYCAALDIDAEGIQVLPLWLASTLGALTRNHVLRDAARLMRYFQRVGEPGDPEEADRLLGAPTTTLEGWVHGHGAPREEPVG